MNLAPGNILSDILLIIPLKILVWLVIMELVNAAQAPFSMGTYVLIRMYYMHVICMATGTCTNKAIWSQDDMHKITAFVTLILI